MSSISCKTAKLLGFLEPGPENCFPWAWSICCGRGGGLGTCSAQRGGGLGACGVCYSSLPQPMGKFLKREPGSKRQWWQTGVGFSDKIYF